MEFAMLLLVCGLLFCMFSGSVLTAMVKVVREGKRLKKLNPGALGSFLDYAEKANGGTHTKSFVEGIRSCFRMLPVFTCIIFYWVVYIQVGFMYINYS